jgi:[ribosomal protein S5]-alanine N-acetyltransferase
MPVFRFTPFPELTTERLILRQLRDDDAEALFVLRADADVARYVDRRLARSAGEALMFIDRINEGIDLGEAIFWAITVPGEDRLIGTICLWNISDDRTQAEIGYELIPAEQGKGIMQEAARAVIPYGFATMGLRIIEAVVHPENAASIRLLVRNGFAPAGMLTENDVDLLIYALTAPASP